MESVNAVGRRRAAVARVIVKEGNGAINITCNHARRTLDKYFPSSILQYIVLQPLKTLDCTDKYDISVNIDGGGYKGQAEALRLAIARGDISQAERLLNAVSDHNAEWSFLMGNVCYRRGWLDEAKRYFETACRMDPENPEYRQALAAFNNRGYRPQGYQTVSTSCGNDACSNWCLATLCCNLLGGGGYFCLPCMF